MLAPTTKGCWQGKLFWELGWRADSAEISGWTHGVVWLARRGNWAERVVLRFLSSEVAARAGEGMNSLVMPAVGQGQMREGGQELGDKRRTER